MGEGILVFLLHNLLEQLSFSQYYETFAITIAKGVFISFMLQPEGYLEALTNAYIRNGVLNTEQKRG